MKPFAFAFGMLVIPLAAGAAPVDPMDACVSAPHRLLQRAG